MAMCMTPFSGPSHRSWLSCSGARAVSARSWGVPTGRPTSSGSTACNAVTTTSLPRPMVKTKPSPSVSSSQASRT